MSLRDLEVLSAVMADMKKDAKEFDGRPFSGSVVGSYFGYQGAAITAIAKILKTHLKESENENARSVGDTEEKVS